MQEASAPAPGPKPPGATTSTGRLEVVDWLRGLAVVLIILAHGMDAWLVPAAKTGAGYEVIRLLSGLPARLFLLLVGVSAAIQIDAGLRKGVPSSVLRGRLLRRGLVVLALAYVFRLQEWVLSSFYGGWETLFRVDILNAIGASMLMVGLVSTPRGGRRQLAPSLAVAAVFLGLGTVIGPAVFPAWIPRPLSSYLGGQRPMAWFSLFPWGAWALLGVAVGYFWVAANRDERSRRRGFALTFAAGVALTGAVMALRLAFPDFPRYPSEVIRQMGPGIFFHRLGLIGMLAGLGFVWCRLWRGRFSVLRQLGRTSLLVYWVHIELCYGSIVYGLRERFQIPGALLLVCVLTLAMLGLSLLKTRTWPLLGARLATVGQFGGQRRKVLRETADPLGRGRHE